MGGARRLLARRPRRRPRARLRDARRRPRRPPPDGVHAQAVAALERIRGALEALGGTLADVVRTRMYVVDVERNQFEAGRAHAEYFGDVRPASAMIGIAGLVAPEFLIEIEADAILTAH